jgi:hypothetical protein
VACCLFEGSPATSFPVVRCLNSFERRGLVNARRAPVHLLKSPTAISMIVVPVIVVSIVVTVILGFAYHRFRRRTLRSIKMDQSVLGQISQCLKRNRRPSSSGSRGDEEEEKRAGEVQLDPLTPSRPRNLSSAPSVDVAVPAH